MEYDEMIDVIAAKKDGHVVEYTGIGQPDPNCSVTVWKPMDEYSTFDFNRYMYRIRDERVFWYALMPNYPDMICQAVTLFKYRQVAQDFKNKCWSPETYKIVRVIQFKD